MARNSVQNHNSPAQNAQYTQNASSAPLSDEVMSLLKEALTLHQTENLKAAEQLYKKALINSRHQIDVASMVAVFYHQIGRYKFVITLLNKALSQSPDHTKALTLLSKAYLANEDYDLALKTLEQAEILAPSAADIKLQKAICLHRMARLDEALTAYKSAHSNKAELALLDQLDLYHGMADLHLSRHERVEAITCLEEAITEQAATYDTLARGAIAYGESTEHALTFILKALELDSKTDTAKALFARSCEQGQMPPLGNDKMKAIIEACLESPTVNQQSIALPWVLNFFLLNDKELAEDLFEIKDYESFITRLKKGPGISLFLDPYFLKGLSAIRPTRVNIERIFVFLRRYCLETIKQSGQQKEELSPLLAALAQQSFENEYIFAETKSEYTYITALETDLKGKLSLLDVEEQTLLLYAAYRPLISLPAAGTLVNAHSTKYLEEVITLTVTEPLKEQQLKKSIRSFSAITNETSKAVKSQYEENPYPRWRTESIFKPYHTDAIAKPYQKKLNVLIAGCGTGKHILTAFHVYPNAKFTAIDISLSSLAYAKRKLMEYDLDRDVSLYQCDLLEVEKLPSDFDYIECCGVLHHIKNPPEGLKALTKKLKPGGKIKLALYSSTARSAIINTRHFIEEKGYQPNREDILACRQLLIDEYLSGNKSFPIHKWRDFYTLSECRDLLFHIQEHNYNLGEISALLKEAGLEFERFSIDTKTKAAYDEMFGERAEPETLKNWAEFEAKYPETFAGMYQFRSIKP